MKIDGEITVKAPRARIFDALRDPYFFATCIDGVRDLTQLDANRYDAVLETRVAYIQFKFKVVVEKAVKVQLLEMKILLNIFLVQPIIITCCSLLSKENVSG